MSDERAKASRPTIHELEKILSEEPGTVEVLPSGEVVVDKQAMLDDAYQRGLADGAAREREACAALAFDHGDFCLREAQQGGSEDLRERAKGGWHIGERIRARTDDACPAAGRSEGSDAS